MKKFIQFLEENFVKPYQVLFIFDPESKLINIEDLIDFNNNIVLFGINYQIKVFKTTELENFYLYFEKNIRNLNNNLNILVILCNNAKLNLKDIYLNAIKSRTKYFEFNLVDFLKQKLFVSFDSNLTKVYSLNWYLDKQNEIFLYRVQHQREYETGVFYLDHYQTYDFFKFIKEIKEDRALEKKKIDKPLFVVDLSVYEFIHILKLINDAIKEFKISNPQNVGQKIEKISKILKKKIIDMLGKIPISPNKSPRKISSEKIKKKIAGNFLITINNLKLLEEYEKFQDLYQTLQKDELLFYQKLKKIVLVDGKWNEYIEGFKQANQNETIKSLSQYYDYIIDFMFRKYHQDYPNLKKERWSKQLQYVIRWLIDPKLHIIEKLHDKIGFKISEECLDIKQGLKIYKHVFSKNTKTWSSK